MAEYKENIEYIKITQINLSGCVILSKIVVKITNYYYTKQIPQMIVNQKIWRDA